MVLPVFYYLKSNVEALAEELEILNKSPALRKRMGEAGWLKYERKFTLEIFEKDWFKFNKSDLPKIKSYRC